MSGGLVDWINSPNANCSASISKGVAPPDFATWKLMSSNLGEHNPSEDVGDAQQWDHARPQACVVEAHQDVARKRQILGNASLHAD